MSDVHEPASDAEIKRSFWPGWIWAVPIAAFAVAGWLGVRALVHGGENVVVVFDNAYGMKADETIVTMRGVKIGDVSDVSLADDGHHVEVALKIDRRQARYLRTGTRFWLLGAQVELSDPASMKAALAGPEIEMEPGPGQPTRHFVGESRPPAVAPAAAGTSFVLDAERIGSLDQGTPVYYAGKQVGAVTAVHMLGAHRFAFDVFVGTPYDRFVTTGAHFWDASAVELSASGAGIRAQLLSPKAVLSGGVAFDAPGSATDLPRADAGTHFKLYASKDEAARMPVGPTVTYVVHFDGAVGELEPGAPVRLRGFPVGTVTRVQLSYDARTGTLDTPVRIALDPTRLDLAIPEGGPDRRAAVDAMLKRLVASGLRARLTQDPPLVGAREVALDFVPGAAPAQLVVRGDSREIPSAPAGDIDAILAHVDQVATTVAALPIAQTARDIRRTAAQVAALTASPQIRESVEHIDHVVTQLDSTLQQVSPQIGPLVTELRDTAREADRAAGAASRMLGSGGQAQDDLPTAVSELTDMARSMRALADYLGRHPEAIVRGKGRAEP
jgi:paraquat-inducible protein B